MSIKGKYWNCHNCGEETSWLEAGLLNITDGETGETKEKVLCPRCDKKREFIESL